MTPTTYPARIEEVEPGEFLVTFHDVPEALTSDDSRDAVARLKGWTSTAWRINNLHPPPKPPSRAP